MTFGDVVLDKNMKFGICSGDQLMEALAKELHPRGMVFCTDVDGVFTADPTIDPEGKIDGAGGQESP